MTPGETTCDVAGPQDPIATERLVLRHLMPADAAFILELLNDTAWLHYIGDRDVHSIEDARRYIDAGPIASYTRHGFGLYLVALKDMKSPIGLCGLLKRDTLDDPDLGFALLPEFRNRGYAREAANAVLDQAAQVFGLKRLLAITHPDNQDSIRLLQRMGFRFLRTVPATSGSQASRLFEYRDLESTT